MGVTRTESGRKWAAAIAVAGAYRNLGRSRSEADAAPAYDAALRELMGDEVVGLNLPDLEPVVDEDSTWPPEGMVDRLGAIAMFGVSRTTWMVWEWRGRIACGEFHRLPGDKPGRCELYPRAELERLRVERITGQATRRPGAPGHLACAAEELLGEPEGADRRGRPADRGGAELELVAA